MKEVAKKKEREMRVGGARRTSGVRPGWERNLEVPTHARRKAEMAVAVALCRRQEKK